MFKYIGRMMCALVCFSVGLLAGVGTALFGVYILEFNLLLGAFLITSGTVTAIFGLFSGATIADSE